MVAVPASRIERHDPLLFLLLQPDSAGDDGLSLARLAEEQGFQVLTAPIADNAALATCLTEAVLRLPVDPQRVWLAGYGAAGQCAARFAIANIDRVAGVCLLGAQYYGADNSDAELAGTRGYRLPVLWINGLAHPNGLLPYNQSTLRPMAQRLPGITPVDFSLVAGYEEQRFWRKLNHCDTIDFQRMAALQERSEDVCERRLGAPFDRTCVQTVGGVAHYCGDALDYHGQVMLRCVGVADCADAVPETAGLLLRQFMAEIEAARQSPAALEDVAKALPAGDFWDTPFPAIGGRTPKAVINIGNGDYRFENFIRGRFGQRQQDLLLPWLLYNDDDSHPAVLQYWQAKGLCKKVHRQPDPGRTWVSYMPTAASQPGQASRRYPLIFLIYKGDSLMFLETFGFIQLAAEQELIVVATRDGNANFAEVLDQAEAALPVDRSRIYLAGHSFGASCAGRLAVSHARKVAGVCLMACQYYGADTSEAEEALAAALHMPLIVIHGTCEVRSLIPLDKDSLVPMPPRNTFGVTTSTMSLVSAFEEQRFWRGINGCKPIGLEQMAAIHQRSLDECERVLGIPVDSGEIRDIDGCRHWIGNIQDAAGQALIRYVGVEGCPHVVAATAAELAWDFWQRFARDPASGRLVTGQ